jgi:hypothetical protein
MKYSEVVGTGFYNIKLSAMMAELVDIHFAGASHHLFRYREAERDALELVDFHLIRHRAHLRHLMNIVYKYGNFNYAIDSSLRDMDERESWNPDKHPIPDPCMFNSMLPDVRYQLGLPHSLCDEFLHDLRPPATAIEPNRKAIPRLRLVANS